MTELADYRMWANQTTVHPVGLAMLALLSVGILIVPRSWTMFPFFVMACFAARQRIVIATIDLDFLRMMTLVVAIRILLRGESTSFRWRPLDALVLLWAFFGLLVYVIQFDGEMSSVVYRAGWAFDIAGVYLAGRCLIRSWDDIDNFVKGAAIVGVVVAAFFLVEKTTARNLFSVFGGVPEITRIREGRLRAQGAFAHPILAGTFWAAMVPLFIAQLGHRRGVYFGVLGIASAVVIIMACSSSTPLMGLAIALFGALMFKVRFWMGWITCGVGVMLVGLHLSMEKPVWHLVSRIDLVGGSTGWHRYHLINESINHIGEWWLLGTRSTNHWGLGLFDVTNQYVLEGVRGGLVTLVVFDLMLVAAFLACGRIWRALSERPFAAWTIGVCLFVHVMSFIAVSYFGQIAFLWALTLAWIGSLDAIAVTRTEGERAGEFSRVAPARGLGSSGVGKAPAWRQLQQ